MRPVKYRNLGHMRKLNCPYMIHSELERLLTGLDELAVYVDPGEALSGLSEIIENKLHYIEEE